MNAALDSTPASPSLMRRHRTFLAPLWLLALGGILMLTAAIIYWNSATTTTVVLIRHAEKQTGAIDDAPLTPQGELRAARLAVMFGDAETFGRVQRIYVTDTRRSQQTAAGVAQLPARSSRGACCAKTAVGSPSSSDTATPCRNWSQSWRMWTRCRRLPTMNSTPCTS